MHYECLYAFTTNQLLSCLSRDKSGRCDDKYRTHLSTLSLCASIRQSLPREFGGSRISHSCRFTPPGNLHSVTDSLPLARWRHHIAWQRHVDTERTYERKNKSNNKKVRSRVSIRVTKISDSAGGVVNPLKVSSRQSSSPCKIWLLFLVPCGRMLEVPKDWQSQKFWGRCGLALKTEGVADSTIHSFIHSFIYLLRITSANKTVCNAMWAGQQGSKTNTISN